MKVLKNMEIIFTVALALACAAAFVAAPGNSGTAGQHGARSEAVTRVDATAPVFTGPMQVVVVSAKRLTPEQKKQSLLEERQQTMLASAAGTL